MTQSMVKQQGAVLLLSLVLIALVTVLGVTALRSSTVSVQNTATLQQDLSLYSLVNGEMVAQLDRLAAWRQAGTFPGPGTLLPCSDGVVRTDFDDFFECIIRGQNPLPGVDLNYRIDLPPISAQPANTGFSTFTVAIGGWMTTEEADERDALLPKVWTTLCVEGGGSDFSDCGNYTLVVTGFMTNGQSHTQAIGFGLPVAAGAGL